MFLLEFVMYVAPGGGLMYLICRFVKKTNLVTVARVDAARSSALLEAARQAAATAEEARVDAAETALEALGGLRESLAVARAIELVDDKVQGLTDYLVGMIEGAPAEPQGRHALPWLAEAITSGTEQVTEPEEGEGWRS